MNDLSEDSHEFKELIVLLKKEPMLRSGEDLTYLSKVLLDFLKYNLFVTSETDFSEFQKNQIIWELLKTSIRI